jgi:hypothetical protein
MRSRLGLTGNITADSFGTVPNGTSVGCDNSTAGLFPKAGCSPDVRGLLVESQQFNPAGWSATIEPSAVPEPSPAILLSIMLLAVALVARKRASSPHELKKDETL